MTSGSSSTGSGGSGNGQDGSAANGSNAPSNGGGVAEILPDGSVRGSDGKIRRPGVQAVNIGPDLTGGLAAGAVSTQKVMGVNEDGSAFYVGEGGLPFYGLQTDTSYPVTNRPGWLNPAGGLYYSFDSAGTAFWRDGMTGTVMSPSAPYASPTLADLQTADLLAGTWNGVKAIPGALWDGVKTIGEGYRGLGYLVTGNIDSYQSNSNVTVDGLLKGVVDNSPVGILGAMADGRYDVAGSRTTGFAFGLGAGYAMPYANRIPGLSYDVGAATNRALWSMGETAALRMEGWLSDQGLILHAVPPSKQVSLNKALGDAWEQEVIQNVLPNTQTNIKPQITIRSNGPSGLKVRLDALGQDLATQGTVLSDMKGSPTAPHTPNQAIVYPELAVYGGTVVGKGKAPYVGGTSIPPTVVNIIRKK